MRCHVDGLMAKVLNEHLRKLIRYGIVEREVFAEVPPLSRRSGRAGRSGDDDLYGGALQLGAVPRLDALIGDHDVDFAEFANDVAGRTTEFRTVDHNDQLLGPL